VERLTFEKMDEFIDPKVQQSLQNIQLKKDMKSR
jgi:hypothetical protein